MSRFVKTAISTVVLSISTPLFAANTAPASNANVTPAEREKIESVVHEYLTRKPEVIVEVMQILQRKQYEEAEKTVKQTQESTNKFIEPLFHTANDPITGNPNGTVTVVEFFDYQCPHCVDMGPILDNLVKSNSNVRVVYKEFPIRGPQSDFATRVALSANLQGKYLSVHTALLNAKQPLNNDLILKLAKEAGADIEKIKTDMNSKAIDEQVKATVKLAQDLKLFGTPAFFIGKTNTKNAITYVPGQMNLEQLQKAVSNAQ